MNTAGVQSFEPVERMALPVPGVAPASGTESPRAATPGFVQIVTSITWVGCCAVGLIGFILPYTRPVAPPEPPPAVMAEILNVELTHEPLPVPNIAPPASQSLEPPPLSEPLTPLPETPPLLTVAEPSAVAFALPVEAPAAIVEPAQASYVRPVDPPVEAPAPVPPVQTLTFGRGEGRQPAPDYPRVSVRQGQEGVVRVHFSVGEDGRVLAAEAVGRCPWPLLNDSALRAVRERWRFPRGAVRLYEVAIRFELKK